MPESQKYLHDKLILLLVSGNLFFAFLCTVLIFLRLNLGQGGEGYIIEYRSNLGISAFKTGSLTGILSFVVFSVLTVVMGMALSMRAYKIKRELAVAILGAGVLLLLLATIVSNALIVLH